MFQPKGIDTCISCPTCVYTDTNTEYNDGTVYMFTRIGFSDVFRIAGFHLCTLIKQLSDVVPGDYRLKELEETCLELNRCVVTHHFKIIHVYVHVVLLYTLETNR